VPSGGILSRTETLSWLPSRLLGRLFLFAAVLIIDSLLIAVVHQSKAGWGPYVQSVRFGSLGFDLVVKFGFLSLAAFLTVGYSRLKALHERIPFNVALFAGHLACIFAAGLAETSVRRGLGGVPGTIAALVLSRAVSLVGVALLALACLPPRSWVTAIRATGSSWVFALLAGGCAAVLIYPLQSLWHAAGKSGSVLQVLTFQSVLATLRVFASGIVIDPATFTLGTARFSVTIEQACSGLEGLGLVLAFTTAWLIYFRKESRFPQALLLVPCALACVWLLNVARIAALILIGSAGAPEVAMVGFHSVAGWMAFMAVAIAFSVATQKLSWVRRAPSIGPQGGGDCGLAGRTEGPALAESPVRETGESAATGAYLVPFLAILAASFVSKAASGYFEWLYPLRFVAAALALWFFRAELRKLNWRFGWMAPLAGTAVFLVWIASSWWAKEPQASSLGAALAAQTPPARLAWIAFRVAAAAITVPIAEELAFRGYLARRIINREFDGVSFRNLTALSTAVSSAVFGLLHGQHWMEGILAGVAYAAVLKWRGRFGDAVVAHATSNLLLAAWVLWRGDWAQW